MARTRKEIESLRKALIKAYEETGNPKAAQARVMLDTGETINWATTYRWLKEKIEAKKPQQENI